MNRDEVAIPPALIDLEAEVQALGGALLTPAALEEVRDALVGAGDFYSPAHQVTWLAALALLERGEPTTVPAVAGELRARGDLDRTGGPVALFDLSTRCLSAASAGYFARKVAERAQARRGWQMALQAAAAFARADTDPSVVADTLATKILEAAAGTDIGTIRSIGDLHAEFEASLTRDPDEDLGLSTCLWPYRDGVRALGDFRAGEVVICAGRPAQGKSTLGLDVARSVAVQQGGTALFVGLEMNHRELWERFVSAEAGVDYGRVAKGLSTGAELEKIERARDRFEAADLLIDYAPGATLSYIRQKARQVQRSHGLAILVIDYLQLMTMSAGKESREQAVAETMRGLKLLAQTLQVPVLVISQLNRGPEQRSDKRPIMSDLRESGSLEQDADKIVLVFREDSYEKESPRAGEVDLIVAKNRRGPTDTVTLAAQLHYARFVDMASGVEEPSFGRAS